MNKMLAIAALLVGTPAAALAQAYQPYQPYQPYQAQQPSSTTTYDRQSGNRYTTNVQPDGSATVRGSNLQNGTTWRSTIEQNGNQRGTDSDGNYWRYNQGSGTYTNTNGTICTGRGAARVCTGPQ